MVDERKLLMVAFPLIVISLLVFAILYVPHQPENQLSLSLSKDYLFYEYGLTTCGHCKPLAKFLKNTFGSNHAYFCDGVTDPQCVARLNALYETLGLYETLCREWCRETPGCSDPRQVCPAVPTTLVIRNRSCVAIVIGGVEDRSFWLKLLNLSHEPNEIPIYVGKDLYRCVCIDNITNFTATFAPELFGIESRFEVELPSMERLLVMLVGLAVADAINPCAIYIYILLLLATAFTATERGSRLVLATGASFVLAVFIGYSLLGLGLSKILRLLDVAPWILSAIAIGFGCWTIASALLKKSRVVAKERMLDMVTRAAGSPPMAFVMGLFLTFTLLPCSAGPYVVFVGIASRYGYATFIPLLLLYNAIFVSPLVAIALIMAFATRIEKVQRFVVEHGTELSILAGVLLILVGIYILLTS